jgi:hypothetical protein
MGELDGLRRYLIRCISVSTPPTWPGRMYLPHCNAVKFGMHTILLPFQYELHGMTNMFTCGM